MMTHPRFVLAWLAGGLLAACAQLPPSAPVEAPAAPAPAPEPPPPELPPAPPPPPPVTPVTQAQAQKLAMASVGFLEAGREDQAKAELQRALIADPNNKLALNLMRQINASDPVAALGRDSFSYTVRANDTLSSLAGRFLGDIYSFYILARYNNIAVPRQVAGGQTLRIPGKAPPPMPQPSAGGREPPKSEPQTLPPGMTTTTVVPPTPAPPEQSPGVRAMQDAAAAEKAGSPERAFEQYGKAASLGQPGAQSKVDALRKSLVARYSTIARTAFAKQDLDGSIRAWDRVLSFDPSHDTAKLERQRALHLKDKVKTL